jgi:hypothetical protein
MRTWSGLKEEQNHREEKYPGHLCGERVGEASCESHRHDHPADGGVRY